MGAEQRERCSKNTAVAVFRGVRVNFINSRYKNSPRLTFVRHPPLGGRQIPFEIPQTKRDAEDVVPYNDVPYHLVGDGFPVPHTQTNFK